MDPNRAGTPGALNTMETDESPSSSNKSEAMYRQDSNRPHTPEQHSPIRTASSFDGKDDPDGSNDSLKLSHTRTRRLLKMRAKHDHDPTDWWFASTAIPLMAATFAPMANMLSIAALVVPWRNNIIDYNPTLKYSSSKGFGDPKWCYNLNAVSLACGFFGNLFLLFNFTQRIRYIIALPVTIFFFYAASGILIGIIVSMDRYTPPDASQVYSQGYWHAVIAAILYMLNSMILMVNMLGYFLGHYPQHFTLNVEQRNLILQTMLFFLWLGGGAGVFTRIEKWDYPDALYFCDVTILTIGFGDFYAFSDTGRGLVFPFSVGGTIILGLMVSSLHKFARELSKDKVVRKHVEKRRVNTLSRAVTMEQLDEKSRDLLSKGQPISISRPLAASRNKIQQDLDQLACQDRAKRAIEFEAPDPSRISNLVGQSTEPPSPSSARPDGNNPSKGNLQMAVRSLTFPISKTFSSTTQGLRRITTRNQKQILMLEERDRFDAMRTVQTSASRFKRYYALGMSVISFSMLWCLGAMVFYFAEAETQRLNYFQGLYFCYVSLLTIGYGDLSPKSNAGKSFFVVWSLIAVPTMTILVSDLGDTLIGGFKRGVLENDLGLTSSNKPSGRLAAFGRQLLHPMRKNRDDQAQSQSLEHEISRTEKSDAENMTGSEEDDFAKHDEPPKTIEELATEEVSEIKMMHKLAYAIRRVAEDLKTQPGKQYKYEEWVEFTRLIRFSKLEYKQGRDALKQLEYDEAVDGVVEWDWLDENSPMASEQSESEWLLDRLCESLLRIFKRDEVLNSIFGAERHKTDTVFNSALIGPPSIRPDISTTQAETRPFELNDGPDNSNSTTQRAITRLLHGEEDDGNAPKWSKRARARMAAAEKAIRDRRRSSASIGGRRHGPFALRDSGSGNAFVGRGGSGNAHRTQKARVM